MYKTTAATTQAFPAKICEASAENSQPWSLRKPLIYDVWWLKFENDSGRDLSYAPHIYILKFNGLFPKYLSVIGLLLF